MFSSNFSDRFKKAMSGFQKAHDDLTALRADVNVETSKTEEHLAKLKEASKQIDTSLSNLAPFVKTEQ